jgi:nitric oxide synthase oxygenase domain/subunit
MAPPALNRRVYVQFAAQSINLCDHLATTTFCAHFQREQKQQSQSRGTIQPVDALIRIVADFFTFLFFLGLAGSAAVIVISFVEDLHELFGD